MDLIISAVTHRSGSTLLQRIFNARKKTLIWGEHRGIITKFLKIYNDVYYCSEYSRPERKAYFENNEDPNKWIPNLTPETDYVDQGIIKSIKCFLSTLYSQYKETHDTIGFKEVRYSGHELQLLRKCYPEAIFILLIRNPLDTWKSIPPDWHEYNPIKKFTSTWNQHTEHYLALNQNNDKTFLIRFEDIIEKQTSTLTLISKIAHLPLEKINYILSFKIGSTINKQTSRQHKNFIKDKCKKMMELIDYY